MVGKFENFSEVVNMLNKNNISYVILRNYDNLYTPDLYLTGHGDIDIMCDNPRVLAKVLGATACSKDVKDDTHYAICIYDKPVSLDLRHIGDGYYCAEWEVMMLKNRRLHENGFYILSHKDQFYSLIYHAIFQKREIGRDYLNLLQTYARELMLDLDTCNEENIIKSLVYHLESYMQENNYYYCYAKDKTVPLIVKNIANIELLRKDYDLMWKHWLFEMKIQSIEFAVKVKHLLLNGKFRY